MVTARSGSGETVTGVKVITVADFKELVSDAENKIKIATAVIAALPEGHEKREGLKRQLAEYTKYFNLGAAGVNLYGDNETLRKTNKLVTLALESCNERIATQQAEIARLKEFDDTHEQLANLYKVKATQDTAIIADLGNKLIEAQAKIVKLEAALAEKAQEFEAYNIAGGEVWSGKEAEIADLKTKMAALEDQIRSLEVSVEVKLHEIQSLRAANFELNRRINYSVWMLGHTSSVLQMPSPASMTGEAAAAIATSSIGSDFSVAKTVSASAASIHSDSGDKFTI